MSLYHCNYIIYSQSVSSLILTLKVDDYYHYHYHNKFQSDWESDQKAEKVPLIMDKMDLL